MPFYFDLTVSLSGPASALESAITALTQHPDIKLTRSKITSDGCTSQLRAMTIVTAGSSQDAHTLLLARADAAFAESGSSVSITLEERLKYALQIEVCVHDDYKAAEMVRAAIAKTAMSADFTAIDGDTFHRFTGVLGVVHFGREGAIGHVRRVTERRVGTGIEYALSIE